jgi:hypothetical protein
MSIEHFLNNFDKQNEDCANRKIETEEVKKKAEEAEKAYLAGYKLYFNNNVIRVIQVIEKKLVDKFDLEYNELTIIQSDNYLSTVSLIPKFEHDVKKVEILFTCEGGRKLITISGRGKTEKEQAMGDGVLTFQDNFETFAGLNLENEFTKILEKLFIKH